MSGIERFMRTNLAMPISNSYKIFGVVMILREMWKRLKRTIIFRDIKGEKACPKSRNTRRRMRAKGQQLKIEGHGVR
jgi:hypothetical protein